VPVEINGELVEDDEIRDILKMIDHDCRECAGEFFDSPGRSEKFRRTWKEVGRLAGRSPQDCFVDHAWKHYHVHVKHYYTARLQPYLDEVLRIDNPHFEKDEYIRDRLFKAIIMMGMMSKAKEAQDVLQMQPGTQAFEGDKFENKHISETYGDDATLH
jgi:hypothetical protein